MTMNDIEKARKLFQKAGLAFPAIPKELAARLKEMGEWIFSTREIDMSPYNLQHYIREVDGTHVEDYVVLSHSGYGVNSYALQYYLVHGMLEMFLHLSWGGTYMDAKKTSAEIRDCFLMADEIVPAAQTSVKLQSGARLRIVGSDFYRSYWFIPGKKGSKEDADPRGPTEVLTEALNWLKQ
jgi:hypothetical protein